MNAQTSAETPHVPLVLRFAGIWLIWATWCNASGWGLSLLNALNATGYLCTAPLLMLGWIGWWKWCGQIKPRPNLVPRLPRERRWLKMCYLATAAFSLVAGVLYLPWSFDSITYRLPRMLYWWDANSWYWIGTLDPRLDYSSTGFEWQMLPLLISTRSDRLLFLLNWLPYLFVPGLTFLAFRALHVSRRAATLWMWVLPTGYCFALQAGGLQNDGYAVNYVLLTIVFSRMALRADSALAAIQAMLSLSLLTSAKLSNLPLAAAISVCIIPVALRTKRIRRWLLAAAPVALLVSFVPLTLLSKKHSGVWSGDPLDVWQLKIQEPVAGTIANIVLLVRDWFQPPVVPASERVNQGLAFLQSQWAPFFDWLKAGHPHFGDISIGDLAYEGVAGIGWGVLSFLSLQLACQLFSKNPCPPIRRPCGRDLTWLVPPLSLLAFIIYLASLGSSHIGRIGAPYYPVLISAALVSPSAAAFCRTRLATVASTLAAFSVIPALLLAPVRPLIPWRAPLLERAGLERVEEKYELWMKLRDDLAPLRAMLPHDVGAFGYAGGFRDSSYGLWKPFGSRAFLELGLPLGSQTPPSRGLRYAVVTDRGLRSRYSMTLDAWLGAFGATVVGRMARNLALSGDDTESYETWYLVRLDAHSIYARP